MILWQAGLLAVLLGAVPASWPRAAAAPAGPREPLARLLGIAPGMSEARAHRILSRLGERVEDAEGAEEEGGAGVARELWRLHDARYDWVQLGVDARGRVRAIQAQLRRDGPGLRYAEIGDLAKARRLGYTILEWRVAPRAGRPGRRVTARGTDSVFTTTVAIAAESTGSR